MSKQIEVFIRHCNESANSVGKNRPEWFSREKCWENLINKVSPGITNVTVLFDGTPSEDHFIKKEQDVYFNLICRNGGNDAASFLNLINHIEKQNLDPETIIYILEDDYIHKLDWEKILLEGFSLGADYITLYDHKDKYFLPMYEQLETQIFITKSTHWRTTPSTTNTYACKFKTFQKHIGIHKQFCDLQKGYTRDHDKFIELWNSGSNLISPIPGWSTHCEVEYLSPCIDWEKYL